MAYPAFPLFIVCSCIYFLQWMNDDDMYLHPSTFARKKCCGLSHVQKLFFSLVLHSDPIKGLVLRQFLKQSFKFMWNLWHMFLCCYSIYQDSKDVIDISFVYSQLHGFKFAFILLNVIFSRLLKVCYMLAWRFRTKIFETFCCRILLVQCKIIAFGFLNKEKKNATWFWWQQCMIRHEFHLKAM